MPGGGLSLPSDADSGRRHAVSLLDATLETTADGILVVVAPRLLLDIPSTPCLFKIGCTYDESMTEEPRRPLRFLTIEQVSQELIVGEPILRAMLKSWELRGIQVGGKGYLVQILHLRPVRSCPATPGYR